MKITDRAMKGKQQPLPCGCIPGEFLCPTAERLWREGNAAAAAKDWASYKRLRSLYDTHKIKEKGE